MREKLIELNNKILSKDNLSNEDRNKHILIGKILNRKNCFLKMDIERSYAILRDLGFKEDELKDIYLKLLDVEK